MQTSAGTQAKAASQATLVHALTPFGHASRSRRFTKIALWLVAIAVAAVVLRLAGVDVLGWIGDLWDRLRAVSFAYVAAGGALQIAQTTLNGAAYYGILRYAYPTAGVGFWPVVTAYAVGTALNNFLPATLGTLVTLLMLVAIIPGATFAGVFAAYLVDKLFFTVVGALVYLYLLVRVGAAFDVELGWFRAHPVLFAALVFAGVALVVALGRTVWRKLRRRWAQAKEGGKILAAPRPYARHVLVPQALSYAAKVGVICVFLAAYSIPVTFHSALGVIGSSSAANMTAISPGGVGVTQAANVVALERVADAKTATGYSITQQLVTTEVNMAYALVLVLAVFGWTGGKALVSGAYADAKERAAERQGAHHGRADPI